MVKPAIVKLIVPLTCLLLCTLVLAAGDNRPSATRLPASSVEPKSTPAAQVSAAPAGEQINWFVISSGGAINSTSTNHKLSGTVSQTAVGISSSASYGLSHGFWQHSFSCCNGDGKRGNVDALIGPSGEIDVADLTYLVGYLFQGGPVPPCMDEANVDALVGPAGPVDVADLTYLVGYLFQGGPAPGPCP